MKRNNHLFFTVIFVLLNATSLFAQDEIVASGSCVFTFSGSCNYTVEYKIQKEPGLITFNILYCRIKSNDCKMQSGTEYYLHYNYDCDEETKNGDKKTYLLPDYNWTQMSGCVNAYPKNVSINRLEIVQPDKPSQYSEIINKKITISQVSPANSKNVYAWTGWFGPYKVNGYDELSYRLKYQPQGGGIYLFKIEFTNDYTEFLEFKYVLEPKWFNHSVDKSVNFDILDGDVKEDKHIWNLYEPNSIKVEQMTVTLFNVMKNYEKFDNSAATNTDGVTTNSLVDKSLSDNKNQQSQNNPVKQILDTISNVLINLSKEQKARNNALLNQQNNNNSDPCGTSNLSVAEQNRRVFGYTQKLSNGKYKHFTWDETTCSWKTKIDDNPQ